MHEEKVSTICHSERSALFALRTNLRSEESALIPRSGKQTDASSTPANAGTPADSRRKESRRRCQRQRRRRQDHRRRESRTGFAEAPPQSWLPPPPPFPPHRAAPASH